jgi:peptidoglycan hydrolase-like protein with peptidoglycan-binding domain
MAISERPGRTMPPHRERAGSVAFVTKGQVMAAASAVFLGAILLNALVFQTERHPAPLFQPVAKAPNAVSIPSPLPPQRQEAALLPAGALPPASALPPAPVAAKPVPLEKAKISALAANQTLPAPSIPEVSDLLIADLQRELGKRGYYKGEADGKLGALSVQAIRDFQFAQRIAVDGKPSEALLAQVQASKVLVRDELLDLIKRANPDDKPDRVVLDVQRALNKVGYGPVTEDGQLGPSTKNALAKFETDKKLPAKGEPAGPVLRVLASASGIPIGR